MAEKVEEEEDWQVICEHSLFANRLHQLEEICHDQFKGSSQQFIHDYLRPVVELLDTIRSKCEEYYSLKTRKKNEPSWTKQYENIVKYAIHPKVLSINLHKGDFYIHISSSIPRTLELKYFHIGEVYSRSLSMSDSVLMCSENWTELLRSELKDRFVYSSCLIWSSKGFDRVTWSNMLKGTFIGSMDINSNAEDCLPLQREPPQLTTTSRESINVEDFSVKPMLILDLNFELLHSQVVYTPGSRDSRGGAVTYFDTNKECWENTDLSSEELTKLLMYYYKIPKDSVQRQGTSFVIDARGGKHRRDILECIGESISMLQMQIPGSVHMAYVLTKKDSLMLLFSASKIKESLNFEFQFVSSIEKLTRFIPLEQLPITFGGQLHYNHEKWIKFRTKVEPFMTGCRSAAKHAMSCMQDLSRTDLGYNSIDCQKILDAHLEKIKEVLEDSRLLGLRVEGKQIIERITADEEEQKRSEDYIDTIECVNRLYSQMTRVFDKLQVISDKRTKNLKLCLDVRLFEENSADLLSWMHEECYPFLEKHNGVHDTLDTAKSNMNEFETFYKCSEQRLTHGEENVLMGKHLIELDELQIDRQVLREKLDEVESELNAFHTKLNECKKKVSKCVEFHQLVQDIQQWWMAGLTYIAHMNMEEIQTRDGIERLKLSILEYKQKNPPFSESQHARITELAHHLGSKQVEQAEQIISRSLEVQDMFQVKQNQIQGAENRFKKPHLYSILSDTDESSSGFKEDDLSTEPDEQEYADPSKIVFEETIEHYDANNQLFSWQDGSQPYDENDAKLAVFDVAMPAKMKERLRHIIAEMITTEHDYVKSLEYILQHYVPEMQEAHLPPTLRGQKNVLFGNIERLHEFHKKYFSQEVESYRHTPLQIGKCFLKWERQFFLYALYNKNKPKSDKLWDDFGNNFFLGKMKELQDKLDLASYLIKPVQRLGKYALLLRDMISCCDPNDPRVVEMNAAHELMKFQLRHGNDLLAMDAIQHSDVNLKEQGCLLRQADFIVTYGARKRVRRVFLFEHALVYTKARKQKAQNDIFSYKHSIKMADIGLTENIGDSGLKFEVWFRRWKKGKAGETFVMQASSENVKVAWTSDITRILWKQAVRNKEYGLTEATTGISVESTPSSAIAMEGEQSAPYNRGRAMDLISPRSEIPPQNKRISWISTGESSNSSGVFDLGSLPEDAHLAYSPRDDMNARVFIKRDPGDIKYNSLPRKKHSLQFTPGSRTDISDNPSATSIRRDPSSESNSFIRNNIYRKTYQVDTIRSHDKIVNKHTRRENSSTGRRFSTQPIVLPSELMQRPEGISGTNSLPRTLKYKRPSNERPISPQASIRKISEESLNRSQLELSKSITDTRIDYGPQPRPREHVIRRSATDNNIKQRQQRYSTTCLETIPSSSRENTPVRKYSFTKAMLDGATIQVDERQKHKLSRQRSASSGNPFEEFSLTKQMIKPSTPTPSNKSPSPRRNPFHNLKTKISKSLSDI